MIPKDSETNKPKTFSCFSENGLISKKEWLLPNPVVQYGHLLVPFYFGVIFFELYRNIFKGKKPPSFWTVMLLFLTSFFVIDFLSALIHCVYIDSSYSRNNYVHNGVMFVNTKYGYSSCHHIFPSNWKDISDLTIITTMIYFSSIPLLFISYFVKNLYFKIFMMFLFLISIIMPISHKYSHEKLHGRYVPPIINELIDLKILLSSKGHQKHHIENNYNWALLNGISNGLFNSIVYGLDKIFGIVPMEESVYNAKKINTKIFKIQFYGDIEGTLDCSLHENLFVEPK